VDDKNLHFLGTEALMVKQNAATLWQFFPLVTL